jgi:DNA-binding transcriptional MerR regulator
VAAAEPVVSVPAAGAGERLRIDDLAQRSGIPSGTIRFYQREGLIPPPEREGRVALYDEGHLHRLGRIRALQANGLPLALVRDLLEREDRGEDIAGWLALDTAVFGERPGGGERVSADAFRALGLGDDHLEALLSADLVRRAGDGELEAVPGILELTERLVEAGVGVRTIRSGTELVAERLRGVAEAMAELGWGLFAAERERIEADQPVADDVLVKLERMRALAERIVLTLFPHLLDEEVRRRIEPYALEVAQREAP